jgi:RNA ligase
MNYKFPTITHISDVLPAIEGRDEFVVAEKDGYTVINYNVMMADTFPDVITSIDDHELHDRDAAIRRECRGIIFDTITGEIIRRPFHKFFNVNERDETQDYVINLSQPHHILEKLDGSMIAPFIVNGEMIWGTKMGATDVSKPVEEFVKNNRKYEEFRHLIASGFTPIFEWCSRKQRIVLDYKEDQLILTAVRNINNGKYVSYDKLYDIANTYGVPCVRAFEPQTDMKAFVDYVSGLEDLEGFVVRFVDGHMLKLKCHWYLQIHKAKEAILQDRNIVELILDEKLDDVKAHLPAEDRERLMKFENDFNVLTNLIAAALHHALSAVRYKDNMPRKEFATDFSAKWDVYTRAAAFRLWDDYSVENTRRVVHETIRNNLTKTVKYEAIRDVWFPGVKYNE